MFEPRSSGGGPSGLADHPRPFVFRAERLAGRRIAPGEEFSVDLYLFEFRQPCLEDFLRGCDLMARGGLGPGRGRAELVSAGLLDAHRRSAAVVWRQGTPWPSSAPPLRISLAAPRRSVSRLLVRFCTPTELKAGNTIVSRPDFGVLLARIRDRLSALAALYEAGELRTDFRALGERAAEVKTVRLDVERVRARRRSASTGRIHPLGGFIGEAEYEGNLGEFVPYLDAASWTGVGRQTVWGKGAIEFDILRLGT